MSKLDTTETTTNVFLKTLNQNKKDYPKQHSWKVVAEPHDHCFVCADGSCYAIENDGNICGLCRKKTSSFRGKDILSDAIAHGGKKLQAFGQALFEFYTANGFKPISYTQFDWRYAPPGCTHEEPLIFYAYQGEETKEAFDDFMKRVQASENFEQAYQYRDLIAFGKRK